MLIRIAKYVLVVAVPNVKALIVSIKMFVFRFVNLDITKKIEFAYNVCLIVSFALMG